MKYIICLLIISFFVNEVTVFDFDKDSNPKSWFIEDDVVMGGRSDGHFYINDDFNGVFHGHVSLENNGGFSSVRHQLPQTLDAGEYEKFVIRVKGDGKRYQLRIKNSKDNYQSYIAYFETNGKWQLVEVPFREMKATHHGRMLNMPNYPGKQLDEVAFLIGNKKEQDFKLEIDYINVQ